MQLRAYQERHVRDLALALVSFRKICAQLATGGGKTVEFCAIASRYLLKNPGKRVVIAVHRKELLKQTRRTAYNGYKLTCQPIIAGMKFIPPADIYVAMVETLQRRVEQLDNVGLVIIDECHIANFNKLHEHFPTQMIIGFSATPLSSSKKKPLKDFYDEIVCCEADIPELIEICKETKGKSGLCQNMTWAPKDVVDRLEIEAEMKRQGLHGRGDYDETIMANAFSKPKYIHNTVGAYEKWSKGSKTIIFNVNVFHSKEVEKVFKEKGYLVRHLDGTMGKVEREEILSWYEKTPGAILCNVGIATTGFDEPTIQTVIVNKATMSMALWLQMCGRGSRPIFELKTSFTIIDMGGNAVFHGDWCQRRNWSEIFHNPPKPGKSTAAPVKTCPECEAIIPASCRECQYCGYVYPAREIAIEAELHEFIMVTKDIDVVSIMRQHEDKKEYFAFYQIAKELSFEAKKTIDEMNDERAIFIVSKYFELAKIWCKENQRKFNIWHRHQATKFMLEQLKVKFPEWNTEIELTDESGNEIHFDIGNIKNITNLC